MNIGIYTNKHKDKDYALTKFAYKLLRQKGADVFFDKNMEGFERQEHYTLSKGSLDALIVFGGDGTILNITPRAAKADIPVLGINAGSFGFLTEAENDNLETALEKLIKGQYYTEDRSMLMTEYKNRHYYALNDIVFLRDAKRCNPKKIIRFEIRSNDTLVDRIDADGLIVSTPTGSTAYSLSAGGPVLSPNIAATVISAICPHSLHFRPLVLCDSEIINIELCGDFYAAVSIDGYSKFSIEGGQPLTIQKADTKAKFIRLEKTNFYSKLKSKLNKWSTT